MTIGRVHVLSQLRQALQNAHRGILVVAVTYTVTLGAGIIMVHTGSKFALARRDSLVTRAHREDPASRADDTGAHLEAAAIDFSRNLGLAAIPETLGGPTIVLPVGLAAYRGWVGGIVSVDGHHRSRLTHLRSCVYYVVTLLFQLAAFTLAGGGGLHLGFAYFQHRGPFIGPRWFRWPRPAVVDVAWLYVMIVPLFAIGSAWEFCWQVS